MRTSFNYQLGLFENGCDQSWSYSRLKTLRRCALEYKVRWVNGEQALFQPGHIDVQAGRVLHHVIREYYRSSPTSPSFRLLLEIYDKVAPRTPAWKDDLKGEIRALQALRVFADSRAARFRSIALEVSCKAWIGDRLFAGQADMIYETKELPSGCGILEFKLNDVEVRSEEEVEKFLQCIIYYMGLPAQFRDSCQLASIYVFDTGEQFDTRIDQSMIERATRMIEETLPLAEGPDFPPTVNPFCSSCGFQNICPAYSKSRGK